MKQCYRNTLRKHRAVELQKDISMSQGESMALEILQVECYTITVEGHIAKAAELLSTIVGAGVDFHAFKAIPVELNRTQFTLFAKDSSKMTVGAKRSGLELEGPYSGVLLYLKQEDCDKAISVLKM